MANKKSNSFSPNQSLAADFLETKRQTLNEKDLPRQNRGWYLYYDSRDLLAWAIDRATAKLKKQIASMSGEKNIDTKRLRLTTAQADAQEIKNETRLARVPVEFAIFTLARMANEAAVLVCIVKVFFFLSLPLYS